MVLIAESGATKTDWRLVMDDGQVRCASGKGLNPSVLDPEGIRDIIGAVIPGLNPEGRTIVEIHFYGAGLINSESSAMLAEALELWCPFAEMDFQSDLVAAARALFGNGSGIVAIMGTGSNSCLYQDGRIVRNIRPGGFILGDEGGGASLGKAFLADFIKGLLPQEIEDDFVRETGLDYARIVQKVYKEPAPSAFLASLAPFILQRLSHPYMKDLTAECLESFVRRALARYPVGCEGAEGVRETGVVGSFGCACEPLLREIGCRYGLELVKFIKSPIDELVKYHGI